MARWRWGRRREGDGDGDGNGGLLLDSVLYCTLTRGGSSGGGALVRVQIVITSLLVIWEGVYTSYVVR